MERYTKKERIFIVEQYFKNNKGLAPTICNFRIKYDRNSDLTSLTVKRLIKKLNNLGRVNQLVILSTLAVLWQVQYKTLKQFVRVLLRVHINSPWSRIESFEKFSTAYSHKRFASSCLQIQLTQELKSIEQSSLNELWNNHSECWFSE